MRSQLRRRFTRRTSLLTLAALAGGTALAACGEVEVRYVQGPPGPAGPPGPKGEKGAAGPRGAKGAAGKAGKAVVVEKKVAVPVPAKPKEPVTLTYTTWWLPPIVYGFATEKALKSFEGRNPGIKVRIEGMSGPPNAQLEKIGAMIAGGTPPDISLIRPHHMGFFTSRKALVAVDDRLRRERGVTKEDFFPVTLARLAWAGKLWGLPAEVWFLQTLYNKTLFTLKGQPLPSEQWTWDNWLKAARELTDPPAQAQARNFGADQPAWQILVWAWGGKILNEAETACVVNRSPGPAAIQWRADLVLKHQVVPSAADRGKLPFWKFFPAGRLGLLTIANWAFTDIEKAAEIEWGVAPIPKGPARRATWGGGANFGIFNGSKHLDEAWKLQADLSVGEGMKVMLAESSLFPPTRNLAKIELLPRYKAEWLKSTLITAKDALQPHFNNPKFVEMNQIFNKELGPVWAGKRSAQAGADEAARLVTELLKRG